MLNARGVFHPAFFYHARPVVNSAQPAFVRIYAPTGNVANWTPGTGMANNKETLVWEGSARLQPNLGWRARPREFAGEYDATHAVLIQVPMGKNQLGMVVRPDKSIQYGADVSFFKDFVVRVVDSPVVGTDELELLTYTVRNAIISSNAWSYQLLCDVGTNQIG